MTFGLLELRFGYRDVTCIHPYSVKTPPSVQRHRLFRDFLLGFMSVQKELVFEPTTRPHAAIDRRCVTVDLFHQGVRTRVLE